MDWSSAYLYDKLLRLIRNPDYVEDIKNVQFDDNGFEIFGLDNQTDAIREKWQLDTLVSPEIKISEDAVAALPIFKSTLPVSVSYCLTDREMTESEEIAAAGYPAPKFPDPDEPETILESTPIWDDHCIKLTIDVHPDWSLDSILEQVKSHIQDARSQLSAKDHRLHFEKRTAYYRVWDLRKEKTPFKQIAKELGIQEEDAKRHYYKAYYLILGEPFDKEKWSKILSRSLRAKIWEKGAFDEKAAEKYLAHEEQHRDLKTAPLKETKVAAADAGFNELAFDLRKICNACEDVDCKEKALHVIENQEFMPEFTPCPDFFEIAKSYQ